MEYPLSDGNVVYMTPQTFKDFTGVMSKDAKRKTLKQVYLNKVILK